MEESPAQRAARVRREKREAKIKAGGSARLDRITGLSGRAPASLRDESPSSSNNVTPPSESEQQQQQPISRSISPLPPPSNAQEQSPEQLRAQEEYLRALLRSQQPASSEPDADPTKLLSSLLGVPGPGDAPNASPMTPGGSNAGGAAAAAGAGGLGSAASPELNPSDLASALGIPSSLANIFFGQKTPVSPADERRDMIWKTVHLIFAFLASVYLLILLQSSLTTYGTNPPPPATAQNPFAVFVMGELFLSGARMAMASSKGGLEFRSIRPWKLLASNIVRDGRIMVFVMGMGSWLGVIGQRVKG